MNNAAVIVFRRSTLPKVLKLFAMPRIDQIIELNNAEDEARVYIIGCPVMKEPGDNWKVARSLLGLCLENSISFFIGKNIEYYLGSSLERMENRIERGGIDEIKAIKDLAALIKLSGERNVNMLNKNMCFIGESYSYQYISTIAEEAAGVCIYEYDKMDSTQRNKIFEGLMAEKGISAVFTKDLNRAISQCDIILADSSVRLDENQRQLSGKILIGSNVAAGNFEKINRVLLWYRSLEGLEDDNILISFNDELLGIMKYFYGERSSIDFIRKFPYIFLSRNGSQTAYNIDS